MKNANHFILIILFVAFSGNIKFGFAGTGRQNFNSITGVIDANSNILPGITAIDAYDTVFFDLSQAFCTGTSAQFPVKFKSDDVVWALDFSLKFNLAKMAYSSIIIHKPYLLAAANYNTADSTLRFTSFGLQQLDNDTPLVSVCFSLISGGQINESDLNIVNTLLNGDMCSYKIIGPLQPVITPSGPTTISLGDSLTLTVTTGAGNTFLWSTAETTQSIVVDTAGTYSVTVTTQAGCSISLAINVFVTTPLPVELVEFKVKAISEGVLLSWKTFSEINNDYFTVERTGNLTEWEPIEIIEGSGTSTALKEYFTVDESPLGGMNYYRLKQTDFNGSFTYSGIESIHYSKQKSRGLELASFPNPAGGILNVVVDEEATIQLLDINGSQVFILINAGANQNHEISVRDIANGIYMLKVYNDSFVSVKKVVISNY